jgi:hypothetical protein
MRRILLPIVMLLFAFSAKANSLQIVNGTCASMTLMVFSTNGFYGIITVPAGGTPSFTDPLDFASDPSVNNVSGYTPLATEDFINARVWEVSPQANALSIYPAIGFASGWVLSCLLSFDAYWIGGTGATIFLG